MALMRSLGSRGRSPWPARGSGGESERPRRSFASFLPWRKEGPARPERNKPAEGTRLVGKYDSGRLIYLPLLLPIYFKCFINPVVLLPFFYNSCIRGRFMIE